MSHIIYACFLLHNFCGMSNIQIDEDLVQMHMKEAHIEDKALQAHQEHVY